MLHYGSCWRGVGVTAILLAVMGLAGAVWGVVFLFNVRGAADKAAQRRNAVRAAVGARTMQPELMEKSIFGPWFFRLAGGVVAPGGLLLMVVGLAFAFAD